MIKNKRYFKREWEEEYYIFDSEIISEKRVDKFIEYDYKVFADAMTGDTVVERLNKQEEEINTFKSLIIDDENELKELKKENERYKFAYNQLTSYVDANFNEYMTQKKLNERIQELKTENEQLKKEKQELEERNQRQYKRLYELWELIFNRDWKTLEEKAVEFEENEKLLETEHKATDIHIFYMMGDD